MRTARLRRFGTTPEAMPTILPVRSMKGVGAPAEGATAAS
jgi:hypothetical protein